MLSRADFTGYPPRAKAFASANVALLNKLPTIFAAILLREIITLDWKFPAERGALEAQLKTLSALSPAALSNKMAGFAAIRLTPELQQANWATHPAGWMEQLTATLWSTGQTDHFRGAAESYAAYVAQANPTARPPQRRLIVVLLGRNTPATAHLFRKLRPHGTLFTHIDPSSSLASVLAAAGARARTGDPYAHWYIDGGVSTPVSGLTQLSYASLAAPRTALLRKTEAVIASGSAGPEALRSLLARLQPADIGLSTGDAILDRFQLSLLTEGSGTQIFATTFVQWAARECLRRAQPQTLILRFAPRQVLQPMNHMLSVPVAAQTGDAGPQVDLAGSLIDADIAAFYTWINSSRLSGADEMTFLAWHEGHSSALGIAPSLPGNTVSTSQLTLSRILELAV